MAAFEYLALDGKGKSRKGVLDGDSSRQIRSLLRTRGLYPVEIYKVEESRQKSARVLIERGVSAAGLALMTRQLATMVRAGMPIEECLRALGDQVGKGKMQSVIAGVRAQVTDGSPLHDALAQYPRIFPELYRAMVEAGESSGNLEEVLERLADYTEERHSLNQRLKVAMIYPSLVTMVALSVVIALLTYVVPEVIRVFEIPDRNFLY